MTRCLTVFNAKCLGCLLIWACCGLVLAAETVITTADRSVLRVIVQKTVGYSSGTGFVVGPGDVVATNNHVVGGGGDVFVLVKQPDGKLRELPATITWTSPDYDLALLKVPGLGKPPLQITDQLPGKGSQVTAIGYPGVADREKNSDNLAESTVTQGIIGRVVMSSWQRDGLKLNILQHSAAVNSGNSGGPLIDPCGRLVGVNTQKALGKIEGNLKEGIQVNQSDGIFFASHVAVLLDALKQQGVTASVTSEDCRPGGASAAPASPVATTSDEVPWILPGAIGVALLLALGALAVALKKSVAVRETYTQYKRRAGVQQIEPTAEKALPKWLLYGRGSTHQAVEFVVDAASCQTSPLIIGRDRQCQLTIDDSTVSRRHACVLWSAGSLQVADLGSTNGTWVDGIQVTSIAVALRLGQTLTLGKVVLTVAEGGT